MVRGVGAGAGDTIESPFQSLVRCGDGARCRSGVLAVGYRDLLPRSAEHLGKTAKNDERHGSPNISWLVVEKCT